MLRRLLGAFFILVSFAGLIVAGFERDWALLALAFPFCLFAVLVWWFLIWKVRGDRSGFLPKSEEGP